MIAVVVAVFDRSSTCQSGDGVEVVMVMLIMRVMKC